MVDLIIEYQNPFSNQTQTFNFTKEYKDTIQDPQGPLGLDCYTLFWLRKIQAFTVTELSSEHPDFLLEVYNLSLLHKEKEAREDDVRKTLEIIYQTYIVEDSPRMINISSGNRNGFMDFFDADEKALFPEALQEAVEFLNQSVAGEVLNLVAKDPFSRYRSTNQFKENDVLAFQDFIKNYDLYFDKTRVDNRIPRGIMELPVDWDEVSQEIESVIREQVSQALDDIPDPFLMSVEDLNRELFKKASLLDEVGRKLREAAWGSVLVSEDGFKKIAEVNIDITKVQILFENFVVAARYSQMIQGSGAGASYLSAAVSQVALDNRSRWLVENEEEVQERLAQASEAVDQTSSEVAEAQKALADLEQEKLDAAKQKVDVGDIDTQISSVKEVIANTVKEQEQAEKELDGLDRDHIEAEKDRNEREFEQRRREVFEAV